MEQEVEVTSSGRKRTRPSKFNETTFADVKQKAHPAPVSETPKRKRNEAHPISDKEPETVTTPVVPERKRSRRETLATKALKTKTDTAPPVAPVTEVKAAETRRRSASITAKSVPEVKPVSREVKNLESTPTVVHASEVEESPSGLRPQRRAAKEARENSGERWSQRRAKRQQEVAKEKQETVKEKQETAKEKEDKQPETVTTPKVSKKVEVPKVEEEKVPVTEPVPMPELKPAAPVEASQPETPQTAPELSPQVICFYSKSMCRNYIYLSAVSQAKK